MCMRGMRSGSCVFRSAHLMCSDCVKQVIRAAMGIIIAKWPTRDLLAPAEAVLTSNNSALTDVACGLQLGWAACTKADRQPFKADSSLSPWPFLAPSLSSLVASPPFVFPPHQMSTSNCICFHLCLFSSPSTCSGHNVEAYFTLASQIVFIQDACYCYRFKHWFRNKRLEHRVFLFATLLSNLNLGEFNKVWGYMILRERKKNTTVYLVASILV